MRKAFVFAAVLAPLTALPPLVASAGPAEDAVAARQGYFKLLGSDMGTLAGMAKGEIGYNAETAQRAADNMAALSAYSIGHTLIPGTSSADMPGVSGLTPAFFDNPQGMIQAGGNFREAALAMQAVAGQGKGEMAGALGALGGACKACHKDYREKD